MAHSANNCVRST